MNAVEEVSTIKEMSAGDVYDQLSRRISQARGIADCLGNLDQDDDALDDFSVNNATWAIKDLLAQAGGYADALLRIAMRKEGGAA